MATVGSLAMDVVAGVAAGVATGAFLSSDVP